MIAALGVVMTVAGRGDWLYAETPHKPMVILEGEGDAERAPHGKGNVYAPDALWDGRLFRMWYGGQGKDGHDRIAYAESVDAKQWVRRGVVLKDDSAVHHGVLFGIHGGHVNLTDGRYVYMRASAESSNAPLEDFTLMPTHMRSRFGVKELADWQPAEPFHFTKGLRSMKVQTKSLMNPWTHGTLLFDLDTDPGQNSPITDDEVELRMLRLLAALMHDSEAPPSQFSRLGIPFDTIPDTDHLLVRKQAERASAALEPLPPLSGFPAGGTGLNIPILELRQDPRCEAILRKHLPQLVSTELINIRAQLTLHQMARVTPISGAVLTLLAEELASVTPAVTSSGQAVAAGTGLGTGL